MKIYLIIDIPSFNATKTGLKFGQTVAEHIVEHCNEDNVIHTITYHIKRKKGEGYGDNLCS